MNENTPKGLRSILAVLTAMLTFMLTMFSMSTAANAADGNIPNFTDGTINVYKHSNPGGTLTTGDGTETGAEGNSLNGVQFTVYKVNGVDLTTVAGWDVVNGIGAAGALVTPVLDNTDTPTTATINGQSYGLTQVAQQDTAGAGLAAFTGLQPALYVVVEGVDNGDNNITTKTAPFYVALPINDNNEWQKTVNVFPKNVVAEGPQKAVATDTRNDGESATDGTHTWTVTQKIPSYDATNPLTSFVISDDLAKAGVTDGTVASTTLTMSDGTALAAGTDYNVALNGTKLDITFTPAGLAKLTPSATLTVQYTTTGTVGEFTNSVETTINGKSVGTDTQTTYLGQVNITKTDAANAKALDGAEFKICAVAADGTNNTADCTPVNGTTLTTGADNDGENGADGAGIVNFDKLALGQYVVVETQAPAGYVLPANPVTAVTISETATTVNTAITNEKEALPGLPLTGAQGKLLLTITGAGLLLVAFGFIIVGRRRKEEEEANAA